MRYRTVDREAAAGLDYEPAEGTLTWAHADVAPRTISVKLLARPHHDGLEDADFEIELCASPASHAVASATHHLDPPHTCGALYRLYRPRQHLRLCGHRRSEPPQVQSGGRRAL